MEMRKRNVKIVYQYDGSKFFGFQKQDNVKTVQGEIERVLRKNFSQTVNMISSGRTDRGVHALGQVSNFLLDENIPVEAVKRQLNRSLYGEVRILDICEADGSFNSRFEAKARTYLYIMKKEEDVTPFEAGYITGIKKDIDMKELEKIMQAYVGRHDFSSFMKKDKAARNTVREIYSIKGSFDEKEKKYFIEIKGGSFLKTMVRIMVGSALAVHFKERSENYIRDRLENADADCKKILAPSEGLYLYKVEY